MASGIEHRDPVTLLQTYQDYGVPNFSVWSGKRLCVKHESGNGDLAYQELQGFLNAIMQSNTGAVYTLKVHPEGIPKITANSDYEGSTTFMLGPVSNNQGGTNTTVMIPGAPGPVGKIDPAITAKLEKLEKVNEDLLDRLHKNEINSLREDFTRQIAGLKQEPEKSWVDRIFDYLEKKPEAIKDALSGIGNIIEKFVKPANDYIIPNPAAAPGSVAGTNQNTEMANEQITLTSEGALVNPFIAENERGLSQTDQDHLLKTRLAAIDQDGHDQVQNDCLEIIENRIGAAVLSRMLITVACMTNKNLNKLLSNLD